MKIRSSYRLPLILSALSLPASLAQAATILDLTRSSADSIRGESQNKTSFPLGYYQDSNEITVGGSGGSGQRRYSNVLFGYTLPTLSAGQKIESFSE